MKKMIGLESIQEYLDSHEISKIFCGNEALEVKGIHIRNMTNFAQMIAEEELKKGHGIDCTLLKVACLCHDNGRVPQYQLLGNFNDRITSHNGLGLDEFDRWIGANHVVITPEIQVIRYVMYYHGRMHLLPEEFPEEYRMYVRIASDADDIENGCIGGVGYLLRECQNDEKGYNKDFPNHIGIINKELWNYYESGTWFDKLKYCHSYAEYVLFAATLAMKSMKRYGDIAKKAMMQPAYGYSSAVEGYTKIFAEVMSKEDAWLATEILEREILLATL